MYMPIFKFGTKSFWRFTHIIPIYSYSLSVNQLILPQAQSKTQPYCLLTWQNGMAANCSMVAIYNVGFVWMAETPIIGVAGYSVGQSVVASLR